MTAPSRLRVEHLGDAVLGLGDRRPRLSWWLPAGAAHQLSYQVEVSGKPCVEVTSPESVLVPWPGEPLSSAERVSWRVKVRTDLGESEWSAPAWFESGLLDPQDWQASWIEPVETERGAHLLRHSFELDAVAPGARMYATAHGLYETFLNGQRVGDVELAPGFTSYPSRLHVQVYDVTDLLVAGVNIWETVLSDGWYRGRTGFYQHTDGYGETLAFLGQLHVGDAVIGTGPAWQSSTSHLVSADLIAGQVEDRRRTPQSWSPVTVVDHDLTRLGYSPAPATRRVQELRPVAVTRPQADRQVVDLGQNINGWVRLRDLGPAGTGLTLVHGEVLDGSGDVTLDHLMAWEEHTRVPIPLGQTDRVLSAGTPGEAFEPRHTTHGFQYVRVEGHPHRLTPEDVTGVVVNTDLRATGWFQCSDARINRLHEITDWSFRGNACEIPTDCPTRERGGWTGDWQIFVPTAAFLYDVAGFSLKWLRDVVAEQLPDGCITNYAPDPLRSQRPSSAAWRDIQGSSGWGDAIVMVPWEHWRSYADRGVLDEMWPAMLGWVDYAAAAARDKRHPSREQARPVPAPHERFVWDGGYHWGEWLEPNSSGEDFATQDHGAIGTAYLHHSAHLAARIGRLLGHDEDASRLEDLVANVLDAWRLEFIDVDGTLTPDTQANHVRALAFGLVPEDLREPVAARLFELIRKDDNHLGTGFLATPYLLPVLADHGYLDVVYELLFQDTAPSWLAMVDKGASTVWEAWDGLSDEGVANASLNHYSKGAVISFLHRYVTGLQLLDEGPAYRRFRVEPRPGGGLTWAEAVHDSPYGRIEVSWRIVGETMNLTVTVPPGTSAEVRMPDGSRHEQVPGTVTRTCQRAN